MTAIPSDTTLEAARKEFEVLRKLGSNARAAMAREVSDNLRDLVEAGVKYRDPHLDEKGVKLEVMRIMIGSELYGQMVRETGGRL